jgi:glycosyltransferase involved in cell wall biosynthesis
VGTGHGIAYVSFAAGLYGLERMALTTAELLRDEGSPCIFAPPGPIHDAAAARVLHSVVARGPVQLLHRTRRWSGRYRQVSIITSSLRQAALVRALSAVCAVPIRQLSMVHGGNDEAASYGRKKWIQHLGIPIGAVSEYARERLIGHGLDPAGVEVVENFLLPREIQAAPARRAFAPGIPPRRGVIVSRVDRVKRLDLLLDAARESRALRESFTFEVLGGRGDAWDDLQPRAAALDGCVSFRGFEPEPLHRIASADFLLHTCPVEAFGMVVLEAFACRVPVVVPSIGGAGCIVQDGQTGLAFDPYRVGDLERALMRLRSMTAAELNAMTDRAHEELRLRFSGRVQREQLSRLLGLRDSGVRVLWSRLSRLNSPRQA